jgi:hypothetical protein
MSLGNFFEWPTSPLFWVFLGGCVLCGGLYVASAVRFPELTRKEHLACLGFAVMLFLPRLPYLIEPLLGYSVNAVCDDDLWHIQEFASLIHSPRFPPASTFDDSKYLSTYYAPWMFGAVVFWTGLLSTVKQALAINVFVCQLFLAYGVIYAARFLFPEASHRRAFITLLVLYGGFDFIYWLSSLSFIPTHSEWWARDFGFNLQFSSFFTLSLWVPHHVMSALAIFYASYLLHQSSRWPAQVLAGIVFLFAVFSSVFVVIGAFPLLCWLHLRKQYLNALFLIMCVFLVFSIPLWWIYLGKADVGFELVGAFFGDLGNHWKTHERAAFLVFLLILSLELLPLIAAASVAVRWPVALNVWGLPSISGQRDPINPQGLLELRGIWFCAFFYLLSTYFIAFSGTNNYAMRGSIVPICALTWLATPTIRVWLTNASRKALYLGAIAYLSGGLLEYSSFSLRSLNSFRQSDTPFNVDALAYNTGAERKLDATLIEGLKRDPFNWYLLEPLRLEPKQDLISPDRELINTESPYRITASKLLRGTDSEPVTVSSNASNGH